MSITLTGDFSASFLNFTELRFFFLRLPNITGTVPAGFFQLPDIEIIYIHSPVTILFPQSFSYSLAELYVFIGVWVRQVVSHLDFFADQ